MKNLIFITILIAIFSGCAPKFEKIDNSKANLEKVSFSDIKDFEKDDLSLALDVFKKACTKSSRKETFEEVCLKANDTTNPKAFFEKNFTPYKLYNKNGTDKGTITGYYEPLLHGSFTKTDKYKYPVYKVPDDLITVDLRSIYPQLKKYTLRGKLVGNRVIPYDARKKIAKNEEDDVLLYVDNKIDLYFLHIQGSGKVELPSGDIVNVGYANQNGQQYKSIGKYMIQKGYIGGKSNYKASVQGMKKWFKDNPTKVDEVMNKNPSYVFFEKRSQGATGSLGIELVPERTLAVDTRYIPLGMPVFINTKNPVTNEEINQLMVAADTGGAIKGEIRADFFWGFAKEAEKYAGRMKEAGELYILVPN
ncbi:murein transglycosylase A [Arcobacter sp. KX21116]|jgi:membrane-bound lytic murein transglycosylase A|uniref:murein transglycosylase A n=1 Tax=Arcobacter iocasae TaxID=2906515 RepID=UPI0035D4C552|tara:strand:- start:545 stop:1633 length:1089 start_codon:yes stop_codon:yes gene_type:complete